MSKNINIISLHRQTSQHVYLTADTVRNMNSSPGNVNRNN